MPHLEKVYWRSTCRTWHLPTVAGIGSTKFEQVNIVCVEKAVSIHAQTDTSVKLLNRFLSSYQCIFYNICIVFVKLSRVFLSDPFFKSKIKVFSTSTAKKFVLEKKNWEKPRPSPSPPFTPACYGPALLVFFVFLFRFFWQDTSTPYWSRDNPPKLQEPSSGTYPLAQPPVNVNPLFLSRDIDSRLEPNTHKP